MSKLNPLSDKDKAAKRVEPEMETDTIGPDEAKRISVLIQAEYDKGKTEMADWFEDLRKDYQMYEGDLPTIIENLDKESWQSDRNLGLTAAVCDSYQATLLGTCWNPDKIHMIATEKTDIDRKDNCAKFVKWMISPAEVNAHPEIDDFINNRVTQGVSYLKVSWKVWYEWVDRRIPKEVKQEGQRAKFNGYNIKTEHVRFERAVLENIDDLDDLIYPTYGKTLQDKAYLIHIIHKTAADLVEEAERGYYKHITKDFVKHLKEKVLEARIKKEKVEARGLTITDLTEADLMNFNVDILERYGKYERNGRYEEYRIQLEPLTEQVIGIKPLRKITRSGKRPFVGSGLIRIPGLLQGKSMPRLIAPVSNAFNNVFNQKSDFQYVQNCPFGFYKPDESFDQQTFRTRPGDLYPTDTPKEINFPNLTRSLAWAESDINILFQMVERLTGAASYFMSNTQGVSGTATRDMLIQQKSETRFGLWVNRIQQDISEGLTMLFNFYQDWAPSDLGERVLGEEGEQLFNNFSIETIRGNYDVNLVPDITTGSKMIEREIAIWGAEALSQSVWFNPQINPKGNWNLWRNAAKATGIPNIDNIMPPEPRMDFGSAKIVEDKWTRLKQGEKLTLEEGEDVMALFMGLTEKREKEYFELDKEYRQNFDNYMFGLYISMIEQINQQYQQQQSNNMAMQMVLAANRGQDTTSPAPAAPGLSPGQPNIPGGMANEGIVR